MNIPAQLSTELNEPLEKFLIEFALEAGLVETREDLFSERFLTRSIVPHVQKLSSLFNRLESEGDPAGLDPYWKETSNRENLRLAYFLAFMPGNMARNAGVITELARLGFQYPELRSFRGIEWGAGPASGASGVAAGEKIQPIGIACEGNWALIEQDRSVLQLGEKWAQHYFDRISMPWSLRPFHRKVDWKKPLLPRSAPSFHLWLSSFFLNEASIPADELASRLLDHWDYHLENEGLAVIVEPALKNQSRKLLELREALIANFGNPKRKGNYQILLPCLGHQKCGALANEGDWCHEEITWWRPKYLRKIDELSGLDRKTLPFSYLVISKSNRSRQELLPRLYPHRRLDRLVSPAHAEGRDLEFFVCGPDGKRRARYRPESDTEKGKIQRGSIFVDAEIRGDARAARVEKLLRVQD